MSVTVIKDGAVQSVKDGGNVGTADLTAHTAVINAHQECAYKASDDLLHTNATQRSKLQGGDFGKVKETLVHIGGKYRVTFELKALHSGGTVQGRIYVNGVAVGAIREVYGSTWTEFSEDISVNAGGTLQIYCYGVDDPVYVRNLKIKGTPFTDYLDTDGY